MISKKTRIGQEYIFTCIEFGTKSRKNLSTILLAYIFVVINVSNRWRDLKNDTIGIKLF